MNSPTAEINDEIIEIHQLWQLHHRDASFPLYLDERPSTNPGIHGSLPGAGASRPARGGRSMNARGALVALAATAMGLGCAGLSKELGGVNLMGMQVGCPHGKEPYVPLAQDPHGAKVIDAYEKAKTGWVQPATPTLSSIHEGRVVTDECLDRASSVTAIQFDGCDGKHWFWEADKESLPTSDGSLTLTEIRKRCQQWTTALNDSVVHACGVRDVRLSSLSLGGGAWSPVEIRVVPDDFYVERDCPLPKPSVSKVFAPQQEAVLKKCEASVLVLDAEDWKTVPLQSGQIQRVVEGRCWFEGDLPRRKWMVQ
jgi:hypothetical protein